MPVVVSDSSYSQQGYVAPTVFLKTGGEISRWNYYSRLGDAITKFNGGTVTPAGSVAFTSNPTPQTFGINVDFYVPISGKFTLVDYLYMKSKGVPNGVIRLFTPQGSGPFYAVLSNKYFGISATVVSEYDPIKIAALDSLYREVALLKYRYNALVGFLNTLGQRQLNAKEQQIFNEGVLLLTNLNNQISQIKGIELTFTNTGAVGFPIIAILAIVAILSAVAAWTVTAIVTEQQKTKRINDSYDLSRWVSEKKLLIAQAVGSGELSQTQANEIYKTLDAAVETGNRIATESSKPTAGIFGEIKDVVKLGLIGFGIYGIYKIATANK